MATAKPKPRHVLVRAFLRAMLNDDLDICKDIVEALGDANVCTMMGEPALYTAVKSNNLEHCKFLLECKAHVDATYMGSTPLHAACDGAFDRIVRLLIHEGKANIAARDFQGNTPLHRALEGRIDGRYFTTVCLTLLDNGVPINAQNKRGKTALMLAIQKGVPDIVQELVARGCDLNLVDEYGHSALHYAIVYYGLNGLRLWDLLIKNNANLHLTDNASETPLHLAARLGVYDGVQAFLARGANVHTQDNLLRTPLYWAVQRQDETMLVSLLLEHTMDRIADDQGYYPEDNCVPLYRPMILRRWNTLLSDRVRMLVLGWNLPKEIALFRVMPFLFGQKIVNGVDLLSM